MSTGVVNYQCPSCTAPLRFDAESGQLECDFCGSSFSVAEVEGVYAAKSEEAKRAGEAIEASAASSEGADAPDSATEGVGGVSVGTAEEVVSSSAAADVSAGAGVAQVRQQTAVAPVPSMVIYNCPSCGAELICDETTVATSCPYCDNHTVIPTRYSGEFKPDFVLPFAKTKEEAIAALKSHYKGRPFLPDTFTDGNHVKEVKGVYVPFWLFDGSVSGSASFEATRSRTYLSGNYRVTETDHFDVYRSGSISFLGIPVDASTKMPDDYMDSIEPFDYRALVPFSPAYLPGYLADKPDVDVEACGERADARAEVTVLDNLRDTVVGYEMVLARGSSTGVVRERSHYAMLPVWMLSTRWEDAPYLFAMNAQTGKMVGDLPVDKRKKRRAQTLIFLVSFVICLLIALFAFDVYGSILMLGEVLR